MDKGHEVRVYDLIFSSPDELLKEIAGFRPDIIGYSGIASSYPITKEVSLKIRKAYPDVIQMAGGPLSSTGKLMLEHNVVDYVVHGEAEISLPKLLDHLEGKGNIRLEDIGGISYIEDGKPRRNPPEPQISDLDTIEFPAYDLLDINCYTRTLTEFRDTFGYSVTSNKKLNDRIEKLVASGEHRMIELVTSRGCTHACLFCYRHVRGIRRHSVEYSIRHMRMLKDKYGIRGFAIGDELFNNDLDWAYEFFDAIEKEFKGEVFYRIIGARVDKVDKNFLNRLFESGCIDISYGIESGSPKILKEYRKGATVEQNIDAVRMSVDSGLHCAVQLVIGSHIEDTSTILETTRFLEKVNAFASTSVNYLIPLPETPIWKYIQERNIIPATEEYLERVAQYGGMFSLGLNLTKSNDFIWKFWLAIIFRRGYLNEARHRKNPFMYAFDFFFGRVLKLYVSKKIMGLFR